MNESEQIKKRLSELSERSYQRGVYEYSEFLNMAEQDALTRIMPPNRYRLWGGYDNAERRLACFGSNALCGYEETPPVACIKISPLQQKFADALTHRDFLGSLMALGIRREVLGDIILHENVGYLFCLDTIAPYIIENLIQVRHTSVACETVDAPPVESTQLPPESEFVVAGLRCDAVIAAVYNLSRSESQALFAQKVVFINAALCQSPAKALAEGDVVSVRGKGRFLYSGEKLTTKKGKLRIIARVY